VVITGANNQFCAGADITEFASGEPGPSLVDICAQMEESAKPIVAAIDGVALGGGLEVALGCHYRLVGNDFT
jgi:3-hydroxyacyl-CoA dehydrogenase